MKGEILMFQSTRKILSVIALLLSLMLFTTNAAFASGGGFHDSKTAILIANFGTTVPEAVKALTNISDKVRKTFPETEVRITFTSNMIRSIWKERRQEAQRWLDMGIPEEVLYVKNIIQTLGDLQEDGFRTIVVQPTHMFYMEQSHDLNAYLRAMNNIRTIKPNWKPFEKIVMSRPALGMPGVQYDYHKDIEAVVKSLQADADQAKKQDAMLVYMGHGNDYWSTGIYAETQKAMREAYPEVETFIGVVEGSPQLDGLMPDLKNSKKKKIILRPFMITAGDHATNDMAGPEDDSWASVLKAEGYDVASILQGLGSNDEFVAVLIDHIRDAANSRGIELH